MASLRKTLFFILAGVSIVAGFILLPLPLPVGVPLIVAGLALLIVSSAYVRKKAKQYRQRYKSMDNEIDKMESSRWVPQILRRILSKTNPKKREEEEMDSKSIPADKAKPSDSSSATTKNSNKEMEEVDD